MMLSAENKDLIERSLGAYSFVRLRDFEKIDDAQLNHLLNAARTEGRGDPWPISVDGPNLIDSHRRWLARKLLDSSLGDKEAYEIVRYGLPEIKG